jgi:hypothetical protein
MARFLCRAACSATARLIGFCKSAVSFPLALQEHQGPFEKKLRLVADSCKIRLPIESQFIASTSAIFNAGDSVISFSIVAAPTPRNILR